MKAVLPSTPPAESSGTGNISGCALVILATFLAYLPALSGRFVWNDSDYVTAPLLRSFAGLGRIWTVPGATQQYYPILHSAFWLQCRLWGDHPLGYHIATLLFHAGSAVMLALVLRRLNITSPRLPKGTEWLAALLFALHPVHVESVAWIAEQKNTLSLLFYLAAAFVHLRFDETRAPRAYAAASALFILALLTKTVTATLPAALLIAFWCKRGRLRWKPDVLPLIPWMIMGAGAGLFSSWVERTYVGAQGGDFELSGFGRVLVAGRAVCFYAGSLLWPSGLSFVYPRWPVDPAVWWQWFFPLGVVAVGAALWAIRRRTRAPLAAFLFFVGSLFPALGFVNLYGARYSWVWDHWQYLPDVGALALVAAGLGAAWGLVPPGARRPVQGLVFALAILLGALTWSRSRIFHDDETLFLATLRDNPACWMAHNNLGLIWAGRPGRLNDAAAEFQEAVRLKPDFAEAHCNLGSTLLRMPGRLNDAIGQYEEALRLEPRFARAHYDLGLALADLPGRSDEVLSQFQAAVRLDPDIAEAHCSLGNALLALPGRLDEAVAQYEEALRLKPDYFEAHYNLALALLRVPGRVNEARAHLEADLRIRPGNQAVRQLLEDTRSR